MRSSSWTQATHQPPSGFKNHTYCRHNNDAFADDILHSPVVFFEPLNDRNHHHHDDDGRHHVKSLFRVGETVLRRSRTDPSTLRPQKASTYDHVHALVQGIEENPPTVFSGKVDWRIWATRASSTRACSACRTRCRSPIISWGMSTDPRSTRTTSLGLVSSYAELIKHLWLQRPQLPPHEVQVRPG